LSRICPAAQEQATLNHAESCAASYRLLYDRNQELLNGFAQILEIVGSKSVTDDMIVRTTIQAVKALSRQPQEVLSRIATEFCGLEIEPTEEGIVRQFKGLRERLINLQKTSADFEAAASIFIEIPKGSKKPDFLKLTIRTLENRQNDSKLLRAIHGRLAALARVEPTQERDCSKLLDVIEDNLRKQRHIIESIATKVVKAFDRFTDTLPLLNQIESQLLKRQSQQQQPSGIDPLFASIFDLIPVTTRADCRVYIPEICAAFLSLHNSVMALKPFASALNEMFAQIEGGLSSFSPGSRTHQVLKTQAYSLHMALNSLTPSKVNSLVFLVVSRFVTLFSAFVSALSA
jgi:hypothetical protein